MSKKTLFRWKYIAVYDNSKNQLTKFELDDCERLKDKMKRQKKRSLIRSKLQTDETSDTPIDNSKKLEFQSQVIFSYCNDYFSPQNFLPIQAQHQIIDKKLNPLGFPTHDFPPNSISFTLPSLVNPNISPEDKKINNKNSNSVEPTKKIILITDIVDDTQNKK